MAVHKLEAEIAHKVAELRKLLKEGVLGEVTVRRYTGYKGDEDRGIRCFYIYFDTPTPMNKAIIKRCIEECGFVTHQKDSSVIGGTYGYRFTFRTK